MKTLIILLLLAVTLSASVPIPKITDYEMKIEESDDTDYDAVARWYKNGKLIKSLYYNKGKLGDAIEKHGDLLREKLVKNGWSETQLDNDFAKLWDNEGEEWNTK